MTDYIHDEWCASREGPEAPGPCNCYVAVIRRRESSIEALGKERDAWKDAALKQAKALGAARVLDDRDWANMPIFVKAAQALDIALAAEEET